MSGIVDATMTSGQPSRDERGIVVFGMHRSGTSAITRALNLLGLHLVGERSLMPPLAGNNPHGFWESERLASINDQLLAVAGAHWAAPVATPPASGGPPEVERLRQDAFAAFRHELPDGGSWVWKDPRLCLLFPFWRAAVGSPLVVLIYRDPIEVAYSLRERDGFTIAHGLALWERYVHCALRAASGLGTYILSFEDLVQRQDIVDELRQFLVDCGVHLQGDEAEAAKASIRADLPRRRSTTSEPSEVSAAQADLYAALGRLRGRHESLQVPRLPDETSTTSLLLEEVVGWVRAKEERDTEIHNLSLQLADANELLEAPPEPPPTEEIKETKWFGPLRKRPRQDPAPTFPDQVPADPQPAEDPDWHRVVVGDLWDEIGRLQFDFLAARGLTPRSYLLDVGCGSLRGGVHFVRFLEDGHYFGVDADPRLLEAGREELAKAGVGTKSSTLVQMDDFDFRTLGRRFDFLLAQSLFTHLPLNSIVRCLANAATALEPDGKFFATFFENAEARRDFRPMIQAEATTTYFDRDPFHYDLETMRWAAAAAGLEISYVGDWNHPRGQKMLLFTPRNRPA